MKIFYTFGLDERYPFEGGWVEIEAENMEQAHAFFRAFYPDRTSGLLNCASYYTEEQFNATKMPVVGNFGKFCCAQVTVSTQINGRSEIHVMVEKDVNILAMLLGRGENDG